MNAKAEREKELNRLRVKNHRERKKLKLESTSTQQPGEESIFSGENDEITRVVVEKQPIDNPTANELSNQVQDVESCEGEILLFGSQPSEPRFINHDFEGSSDDETPSNELIDECLNRKILAGKNLKNQIMIWASKDVAFIKVDSLLRILNQYHPELPLCTKTLLKTNLQLNHKIRKFNVSDPSDKSEFVYFGIVCHLMKIVNISLHPLKTLDLKINVDGMNPYKSSPLNFWPILGLIHHESASYRPFVIAAYFGEGKPYSADLYFDDLIVELNHLCQEGITIDETKFEVRIKCFCCDRPARAFLKRIVNHGAYYACERCWVPGFQYLNRVVYPARDHKARTGESFRNQENPEHHDGMSPLLKLRDKDNKPVDLVKLFIQEFMHAGSLGIMKKLMIDQWFSDDSKMTREKKLIASLRLANIADQVPKELQRTTRELTKLHLWKAKEFRLILLYCAPLVFKGILSDEEYKLLLLLHVPCRILSSKDLLPKFGKEAKICLDRFVLLSELIYGLEFVVLNPHILSHLYEDAVNMDCPITEVDAFIFEGYLSELKKALRSGNRPLAQLCKKVELDLELRDKKVVSTLGLLILSYRESENLYHVTKLKYLNFELTVKKPDNVIMLKDGSLVVIKDLICSSLQVDSTKLYVLGEKLQILGSAFDHPIPSSDLYIYSVKRGEECELVKYPLCDLFCKVMLCGIFELSTDEKQMYAIPLLHTPAS